MAKSRPQAEYGDFQTPAWLAERICARLEKLGVTPAAIVEPTCGAGSFLVAAAQTFVQPTCFVGFDVNPKHVWTANEAMRNLHELDRATYQIRSGDFFALDWQAILAQLPRPLLLLGNPPWVTNTGLSILGSVNQPPKSNFQQRTGIEASTGASNFDIAEWMILKLLEWTNPATTTLALLCKTTVARKVLVHAWQENRPMGECRIYSIDAQQAFGATVDACLLYIGGNLQGRSIQTCSMYADLDAEAPIGQIAFRDHVLVADVHKYERRQHLAALVAQPHLSSPVWRSGIKHDCSPVMELLRRPDGYQNKLGETVQLECDVLFPLYKATDLANLRRQRPDRWLIVTQQQVGEDTHLLRRQAPLTWQYLESHTTLLDKRQSTIYRGQPRFAIFGVGNYSFTPWKVAISAMHKTLRFAIIGPIENKPAVLDDTCYFLPCATHSEAELLAELLNSDVAREFLEAFIFWNDKRPITARLLRKLDLTLLAYELGREREYSALCDAYAGAPVTSDSKQLRLLEKRSDSLC